MSEPDARNSNNDDNNEVLINKMVSLAEEVRQQPPIRLRPYLQQIRRLVTTTAQLYTSISGRNIPTPTGHAKEKIQRTRRVEASDALVAAEASASTTATAIRQYLVGDDVEWLETSPDLRTTHLQLIFSLQRISNVSKVDVRDRVLLACSCHSLATDFEAFEQSQGWKPKYRTLLDRIQNGQNPAISQNSPRHQNFLASLSIKVADREKFDAGLRLGTKIRLAGAIGEICGLGAALGLLLGYECQRLSRMSYKELAAMLAVLRRREVLTEGMATFCNEFNAWWTATCYLYHLKYSQSIPSGSGRQDSGIAEFPASTWTPTNAFGDVTIDSAVVVDDGWLPEPRDLQQIGDEIWAEHLDMAGVQAMDLDIVSERQSSSDDPDTHCTLDVGLVGELSVDACQMVDWEAAASVLRH